MPVLRVLYHVENMHFFDPVQIQHTCAPASLGHVFASPRVLFSLSRITTPRASSSSFSCFEGVSSSTPFSSPQNVLRPSTPCVVHFLVVSLKPASSPAHLVLAEPHVQQICFHSGHALFFVSSSFVTLIPCFCVRMHHAPVVRVIRSSRFRSSWHARGMAQPELS